MTNSRLKRPFFAQNDQFRIFHKNEQFRNLKIHREKKRKSGRGVNALFMAVNAS